MISINVWSIGPYAYPEDREYHCLVRDANGKQIAMHSSNNKFKLLMWVVFNLPRLVYRSLYK